MSTISDNQSVDHGLTGGGGGGAGITALTGDVTASGTGSVAATVSALPETRITSLTTDLAARIVAAGVNGGQTLIGDTASGGNLTLQSTSNGTKGKIKFNAGTTMYADEANSRIIAPTMGTESGDLALRGNGSTFITLQASGLILLGLPLKLGTSSMVEPSANNTVLDTPSSGNAVRMLRRFYQTKGADVGSAGTLTLGTDGNTFRITGTTGITTITTTGWNAGSEVILIFAGALTITHGTGAAAIRLAGSTNLTTTAETVLRLVFDGTLWREVSRAVA